jgi:hypothetical protein
MQGCNALTAPLFNGSAVLARGAQGRVSAHSVQGRYLKDCEQRLLSSLAPDPSPAQRLLVSRLCRLAWRLEQLENSLQSGDPSLDSLRVYGTLHQNWVNGVRELLSGKSNRPPEIPAPPSLSGFFAADEASDAA